MTFRSIKAAFILSCAMLCLVSMQAHAQVNIAVVDVEKILAESKAAQSIQKQVDSKRKGFLSAVKGAEDKLRKDQTAIEKQRSELSKDELIKKAQDFEKQRLEARKSIHEKKNKLDKSYSEAMNILTKAIYEVCQEIANEDEIDLVITRQNIIVGSMSLDITIKVMERLNKKLPSLTLKEQ